MDKHVAHMHILLSHVLGSVESCHESDIIPTRPCSPGTSSIQMCSLATLHRKNVGSPKGKFLLNKKLRAQLRMADREVLTEH